MRLTRGITIILYIFGSHDNSKTFITQIIFLPLEVFIRYISGILLEKRISQINFYPPLEIPVIEPRMTYVT